MMSTTPCPDCHHAFAMTMDRCPHCGRPARFPNVVMAEDAKERQALDRRYGKALRGVAKRGAEVKLRDFEAAASSSVAVIARSFEETQRLANSDNEGYATYYELGEAEVRFPKGDEWDRLRRVADAALFGGYQKSIRFAALSLDGMALGSYGDIAWVLKEDMIAHRASVFEENSVLFMKHRGIKMSQANRLPSGCRATWAERAKLCVAKLAAKVDGRTAANEFPRILLRQGQTTTDDDFVEVHVGGPMTIRTLECVRLMKGSRRQRKTIARALKAKLRNFGVKLES